MRGTFWTLGALLVTLAPSSCSTTEPSQHIRVDLAAQATLTDIEDLARVIQGKDPAEVRELIVGRFGPPVRDIGSGLSIEQWEVAGGVLTFHPLSGPVFVGPDGAVTHLMRTTNLLAENLLGTYEMTTLPDPASGGNRYWLGNVSLSPELRYHFKDSRQGLQRSPDQQSDFFVSHPDGVFSVEYPPGIGPDSRLEDLPHDSVVAAITFVAPAGGPSSTYAIVSDRNSMRLRFAAQEPATFHMEKGWSNYWR